jgi:P-type Ca2+ transporter type 2C
LAFTAILFFCILWKFLQDIKTEHALQTIRQHLETSLSIVRDGVVIELPAISVVQGDLIILTEGSYLPADARLVDAYGLVIDETLLFGGSAPVQKTAADVSNRAVPPEKQRNMVFAGTYVLEGEGRAIVVATGEDCEIHHPGREVPMQMDLDSEAEMQMGIFYDYFKFAGCILGGLAVIIAWWTLQRSGEPVSWLEMLFLGLGFAIAAIPEGIVSTSRAILAENAYKLLRKGIAIRNLVSLEKLSGVTALCVDDVGVLTTEEMMLSHAFVDGRLLDAEGWEGTLTPAEDSQPESEDDESPPPASHARRQVPHGFPLLILAANQCTADEQNQQKSVMERNIHIAVREIAEQLGFYKADYDWALSPIYELPPNPGHPYKVLVFETEDGKFLELMFGAAEAVVSECQYVQSNGSIHLMNIDEKAFAVKIARYLFDTPAQVVGFAYRNLTAPPSRREMTQNLVFLGLLSFEPIYYIDEKEAVESCLDAGVKVVTMTNKDKRTAVDLAREFGIIQDKTSVVSKVELDEFTEEYHDSIIDRLLVYCHPSPEQKLNVIQYLKRRGYSVGAWGRTPRALREMKVADVSFASASRATHIVQEHADCLTFRDGFRVISDTLLHAREMYSHLRNSMRWLLSCALAQMLTLVIGFIIYQLKPNFSMPLNLQQIIWTHLLVNLIPLIGLGHERITGDLRLHRPQKSPPFLPKIYRFDILLRSLVIALMTIVAFVATLEAFPNNLQRAQTAACTTLIFTQLLASFQCHRQSWESLPQRVFANIPMLLTILACLGLHLFVIYFPMAREILWGDGFYNIEPMTQEWKWIIPFCIFLALIPLNLVRGTGR